MHTLISSTKQNPSFIQCSSTLVLMTIISHGWDLFQESWANLNSPKHIKILALMGITQPKDSCVMHKQYWWGECCCEHSSRWLVWLSFIFCVTVVFFLAHLRCTKVLAIWDAKINCYIWDHGKKLEYVGHTKLLAETISFVMYAWN